MRRLFSSSLFGVLVALSVLMLSTATAFADPRDFELVNNTGRDITEIYVTPSNLDDWGDNLLTETQYLPSGNKVPIHFKRFTEGNCFYDVKVVTSDGAEGELNQVNLCETNTVTFS
ncbi:MAG: argininosuccinate lyase [Chloroflexota bacterium]